MERLTESKEAKAKTYIKYIFMYETHARTHTVAYSVEYTHTCQLRFAKTKQHTQSWPNVYKLVRNRTIKNIHI